MAIIIDDPEVEAQLRAAAAARGEDVNRFTVATLAKVLASGTQNTGEDADGQTMKNDIEAILQPFWEAQAAPEETRHFGDRHEAEFAHILDEKHPPRRRNAP